MVDINSENFSQYFRLCTQSTPERGDCIAAFTAVAELVDGFEKKEMIKLLKEPTKAHAVVQMMRKLAFAKDPGTFRVPQEMCRDMLDGMSDQEIAEKPYEYTIELFYYTKPFYVPNDDPHWRIINILNMEDYFTRIESTSSNQEPSNVQQEDSESVRTVVDDQ